MENMLLIEVPEITNRLRYTCEFVFGRLLGLQIDLREKNAVSSGELPKLVYGGEKPADDAWLWAHPLLFQKGIRALKIKVATFDQTPVFFQTPSDVVSILSFDPLAAVFFMLSRYEEHLIEERDELGRFTARQSLAFQHHFLKVPVVHLWAEMLAKKVKAVYPDLVIKRPVYRFIPTLDIDNAFAYRQKGLIRTFAASMRDLVKGHTDELVARIKTLTGKSPDPYDSFSLLNELHREAGVQPIIFWLLGDYGKYDKNISYSNQRFRELIKEMKAQAHTGIHPSFAASTDPVALHREKKRLEEITGEKIRDSRMHYLRLLLPGTYEDLVGLGIERDYSMGFSDESGFRAGVSVPFYYYDLKNEVQTTLEIHPFCVMDATLHYQKKYTAEEACREIEEMIKVVREVGGCFYPIFHNESLGTKKMWNGWREVYRKMLEVGKK